ncbi:MAG: chemotaxis protein CheW [Halothiobacillaceae bacterium]
MTQTSESPVSRPLPEDGLQFLSFMLDGECFGVDIRGIQEVLAFRAVTPVPRDADDMLGVINLRGRVIPVMDLRRHFRMHCAKPDVDTCIVIVQVQVDDDSAAVGILADRVHEVVTAEAADLCPPPRIGNRVPAQFIQAMVCRDDAFVILLDLNRILAEDRRPAGLAEQTPADEVEVGEWA